jgi:putative ABC transport system permease protein
LWRQKLRTTLTLIGVAIGCGTLVVSLACGIGVEKAVDDQFKKEDRLRQITVFPANNRSDDNPSGVPSEVLAVAGDMSDAKRERIQKQEIIRWKRENVHSGPKPLTAERLEELRALPHVLSVEPDLSEYGRIYVDGKSTPGMIGGILPNSRHLNKRIDVGTDFSGPDANEAILNEYLLYRLGKKNDADVRACIGKTVRIELNSARKSEVGLLNVFGGDITQLTEEEMKILGKAFKQIPELMAKYSDLTQEEKTKLFIAFGRKPPGAKKEEEKKVSADLKIVGVIRGTQKGDPPDDDFLDGPLNNSEVLIPQGRANEIFMQLPRRAQTGYMRARIIVDDEKSIPGVVQHIKSMGLQDFSIGVMVQQIRRNVMLIGFAMDFIALVALVVAAVGITNTMFTSVLERTKEIGIMKAVGARDGQVMTMFLVEGCIIGFLGGIAGVGLGWLAKFPGNRMGLAEMAKQTEDALPETLFIYPLWLVILVPVFAMFVTTLAALLPARRAARIEPVDALRFE